LMFQVGSMALVILEPPYLRGAETHKFLGSLRDESGSAMVRIGITMTLDALLASFVVSAPACGQDARERIKESTCPGPTRPMGSTIGPKEWTYSEAATSPTRHPTEESSRGVFVPVITDRAGPSRFRQSGASIRPRVALLCGGGLSSFPATLHKRWLRR
jgi:hypothetical protein